jgi:molybdate transport system permease protein
VSPRTGRLLLVVPGVALGALLLWPLLALVLSTSPAAVGAGLLQPVVARALRLSLWTSTLALVVVVALGTPLAWTLARSRGRAASLLSLALQLPMVVPPAVAGVALLLAFGRRGALAPWLPDGGLTLTSSAVVLAQVFVAAPFYLQGAQAAFRRIDEGLVVVARTLGASPLRVLGQVAVPAAAPGLLAAAAMAWARALGEFGATLLFAGNVEGRTQTLPLAIYAAFEVDPDVARAVAVLLVLVAVVVLLCARALVDDAAPDGGRR